MDQKRKWETPELTVISGIETSEDVLTLQSGGPPESSSSDTDNTYTGQ